MKSLSTPAPGILIISRMMAAIVDGDATKVTHPINRPIGSIKLSYLTQPSRKWRPITICPNPFITAVIDGDARNAIRRKSINRPIDSVKPCQSTTTNPLIATVIDNNTISPV